MNISDVKKMSLSDIMELRNIISLISEKYAKELTTYATMSGDISFTKLDAKSQDTANKRIKVISLLDKIDRIIEQKVLSLADELK